jgi:hypothetical protein
MLQGKLYQKAKDEANYRFTSFTTRPTRKTFWCVRRSSAFARTVRPRLQLDELYLDDDLIQGSRHSLMDQRRVIAFEK